MITEDQLKVIEGLTMTGKVNVEEDAIVEQIQSSIRRGHVQLRREAPKMDRIVLVGGGPSLKTTEKELVSLIHGGAKLVTLNGAYQWCLERNLKPQTQIIMDAREGNERFLDPPVPGCNYLLASQCHPRVWDAVEGRERVWIFHAVTRNESRSAGILDAYYLRRWESVSGGTTVASRAIFALRLLGYLRFDLFGVDCCWDGDEHHAYPQPENERDKRYRVVVSPSDQPDLQRTFFCSGWHLKQYEDFLQIIKVAGHHFMLAVHGDGLLAHTIRTNAESVITEE